MTEIRPARFPDDAEVLLAIWKEFIASPSVSLDYQGNEAEFANLPGKYARSHGGCVLLADHDGRIDGCIAFRRGDSGIAEMKRLYVRPRARGERLGKRLIEALIAEARAQGYAEIRLDVLAEFTQAQILYTRFGFVPADPISHNPLPGTAFLGLML